MNQGEYIVTRWDKLPPPPKKQDGTFHGTSIVDKSKAGCGKEAISGKLGAKNLYIGIGWGIYSCSPPLPASFVTHPIEEGEYIISGHGEDVYKDKTYTLEAGTVVYNPPNIPHRFVNKSDEPMWVLYACPSPTKMERILIDESEAKKYTGQREYISRTDKIPGYKQTDTFQGNIIADEFKYGFSKDLISSKYGAKNLFMGIDCIVHSSSPPTEFLVTHPIEEAVYIISGYGEAVYPDKTYTLEPGTIIYHPSNTLHRFLNKSDEPLLVLHVSPSPCKTERILTKQK